MGCRECFVPKGDVVDEPCEVPPLILAGTGQSDRQRRSAPVGDFSAILAGSMYQRSVEIDFQLLGIAAVVGHDQMVPGVVPEWYLLAYGGFRAA